MRHEQRDNLAGDVSWHQNLRAPALFVRQCKSRLQHVKLRPRKKNVKPHTEKEPFILPSHSPLFESAKTTATSSASVFAICVASDEIFLILAVIPDMVSLVHSADLLRGTLSVLRWLFVCNCATLAFDALNGLQQLSHPVADRRAACERQLAEKRLFEKRGKVQKERTKKTIQNHSGE